MIRNIIFVDVIAGILLVFSAYLFNVESFLHHTLARFIRYDFSLVLATSLLQLFITLAVFFRWINENYEIREKEIIIKKGIFSVTQKSFPIKDIKEALYRQNLLEKLTNCGTVVLYNFDSKTLLSLRNIENAEIIADTLNSITGKINFSDAEKEKKLSVLDLILAGENNNLEFKQTFRWDEKRRTINKELERAAMKEVASFLNLEGGNLILGVNDNKSVNGLESDYKTLGRQDRDGFETHFNNIFNSTLSPRFRQFVKLNFDKINNRDVCLVKVSPSDAPVYLKANNSEEFYVRTGNTTTSLTMSEVADYIKTHWKES